MSTEMIIFIKEITTFDELVKSITDRAFLTPSAMPEACKLQSKQLQPDYVSSQYSFLIFY